MRIGMVNLEMFRPEAAAHDLGHFKRDARQAERGDAGLNRLPVGPGIHECGDGHIAADAGRAIEIENTHVGSA
jgi:hypothetical protein